MEKPNFKVFRESLEARRNLARKPVKVTEAEERQESLEQRVLGLMDSLNKLMEDEYFYVALLINDHLREAYGIKCPSKDLIYAIKGAIEDMAPESMYDGDLIMAIDEVVDNGGFELECEIEDKPEPKPEMHERLGEFRKGKEGRRHMEKHASESCKPVKEDVKIPVWLTEEMVSLWEKVVKDALENEGIYDDEYDNEQLLTLIIKVLRDPAVDELQDRIVELYYEMYESCKPVKEGVVSFAIALDDRSNVGDEVIKAKLDELGVDYYAMKGEFFVRNATPEQMAELKSIGCYIIA